MEQKAANGRRRRSGLLTGEQIGERGVMGEEEG